MPARKRTNAKSEDAPEEPLALELESLPEARQETIARYAREHSPAETAAWLRGEGLEAGPNQVAFFLWWRELREMLSVNEATVGKVLSELRKMDPPLSGQQAQELGQKFFTALALRNRDVRGWSSTQMLQTRIAKLQLEFDLYRQKVAEAKATVLQHFEAARKGNGVNAEILELVEAQLALM